MKQVLFCFSIILFFSSSGIYAQPFVFFLSDSIEVFRSDTLVKHAWAGGLNSVQVNTIDLNEDGKKDLLLYDRSTDKISTFLNTDSGLLYAPYLETGFPEVDFWMLLRDYDGDGLKDIFTGTSAGIKVYKNKGFLNGSLEWELIKDPVFSLGFSGRQVNLKIDITDVPAITDIDNDGDLDIFNFVPLLGGSVEFHKNLSIENFGVRDSLVFEKVTDRWAGMVECGTCSDYFFDGGASCRRAAIEHAGSALLVFDNDGDGDKELLLGEADCTQMTFFENKGSETDVVFDSYEKEFLGASVDEGLLFSAAFFEDVDFDEVEDLIVSSNLFANETRTDDFAASVWRYKRPDAASNQFQLIEKDFLQKDMLDLGEGAYPAVADEDGDGDLDLFIANKGRISDGFFVATIQLYTNEGNNENPIFKLTDEDYLNLSRFSYQELKVQFKDINQDNRVDLIYTGIQPGTGSSIRYLLNLSTEDNTPLSYSTNQIQRLDIPLERLDEVHFEDVDKDGNQDLLVGRFTGGELVYYRNNGNLDFAEPVNGFGGITFNNLKRELSIETADLDNDGNLELITGDRSGNITIYPFFQQETQATFTAIGDTIFDATNNRFVAYNFGAGIYPVVFGKDIIVGTEAGGVRYLRNWKDSIIIGLPQEREAETLKVYPNPFTNSFNLEIPQTGIVKVFNTQGKLIFTKMKKTVGEVLSINMGTNFPNGLYILTFESKGRVYSKKILQSK